MRTAAAAVKFNDARDIATMTSMGCLVLPNIAMLASPVTASCPRTG